MNKSSSSSLQLKLISAKTYRMVEREAWPVPVGSNMRKASIRLKSVLRLKSILAFSTCFSRSSCLCNTVKMCSSASIESLLRLLSGLI
jgi:hypothetical protein